jgi:hypothetical protein
MRLFRQEIDSYPKALVAFAAVFLASSGLCGVQWAIATSIHRDLGTLGSFILFLRLLELAAMALSAIGIVVVLIAWPVSRLYDRFAKPPQDRVQRLFDTEDAVDEDDPL